MDDRLLQPTPRDHREVGAALVRVVRDGLVRRSLGLYDDFDEADQPDDFSFAAQLDVALRRFAAGGVRIFE